MCNVKIFKMEDFSVPPFFNALDLGMVIDTFAPQAPGVKIDHRFFPIFARYDPRVKNCNHGSLAPPCHLDHLDHLDHMDQQLPGTLPPIPQHDYPRHQSLSLL